MASTVGAQRHRGSGPRRSARPARSRRSLDPDARTQRRRAPPRQPAKRRLASLDVPEDAVLELGEPGESADAEDHRHEEIEAQPKDVVGGVNPKQLLTDSHEGVAGDVEGEEARGPDPAVMAEPHQRTGERQVPDQLIEEGRVEGRELLVARRAVRR